jgi:hypothetical protein
VSLTSLLKIGDAETAVNKDVKAIELNFIIE